MTFSDSIVQQAWQRAGGKCECERTSCGHTGKCSKQLTQGFQGWELAGGWEAHHITAGGQDTLSNCEILCQPCHKNTGSYGG